MGVPAPIRTPLISPWMGEGGVCYWVPRGCTDTRVLGLVTTEQWWKMLSLTWTSFDPTLPGNGLGAVVPHCCWVEVETQASQMISSYIMGVRENLARNPAPYMAFSDTTPIGMLRCLIIASQVWKSRLESNRDRSGDLKYSLLLHKLVEWKQPKIEVLAGGRDEIKGRVFVLCVCVCLTCLEQCMCASSGRLCVEEGKVKLKEAA